MLLPIDEINTFELPPDSRGGRPIPADEKPVGKTSGDINAAELSARDFATSVFETRQVEPKRRGLLGLRLQREHLVFACAMLVLVGIMLEVGQILLSRQGQTPLGTTLGGDFPCFYIAGGLVRQGHADQLYDLGLQDQIFHSQFPKEDPAVSLPYVYPPAVAAVLSGLSAFSYPKATAIWAGISFALYGGGVWLLMLSCRELSSRARFLAVMLSLSFEPFLIECLHGGQLSVVAFAAVSLAIYLGRRGDAFASGMSLGICAYKPTLMVILLPAMVLGRRWVLALGVLAMMAIGALASWATVGTSGCLIFVERMRQYARVTASGEGFRLFKFVDISAFVKLVTHQPSAPGWTVSLPLMIAVIFGAGILWRRNRRMDSASGNGAASLSLCLAATLACNLYVGIYDSILIVPAIWLLVNEQYDRFGTVKPAMRWLIAAVAIGPWITQPMAQLLGVQIYTLILLASGGFAIAARLKRPVAERVSATAKRAEAAPSAFQLVEQMA